MLVALHDNWCGDPSQLASNVSLLLPREGWGSLGGFPALYSSDHVIEGAGLPSALHVMTSPRLYVLPAGLGLMLVLPTGSV